MSENTTIHREAFWLLAGDKIGTGMTREVFAAKLHEGCVVKVEDSVAHFQNVMEWQIWQAVKDVPHAARWFAPCKWISFSGSLLVMERTRPAAPKDFPKKLPLYLSDTKRQNFGLYEDRLVCHDYGTALMLTYGMTKRERNVDWWDA